MENNDINMIIEIIKSTINDSIEEIIAHKLNDENIKNIKINATDIEIVKNDLHTSMKEYIDEMTDVVLKDLNKI